MISYWACQNTHSLRLEMYTLISFLNTMMNCFQPKRRHDMKLCVRQLWDSYWKRKWQQMLLEISQVVRIILLFFRFVLLDWMRQCCDLMCNYLICVLPFCLTLCLLMVLHYSICQIFMHSTDNNFCWETDIECITTVM